MGSPRILIVRTSALGDVVHCLPVLTALRRRLPEARLGWVVETAMAPLLEGHPDLDALIPVRLRVWRRRPLARATAREIRGLFERLDRFAPDVVLDLMGNHKGGLIAAVTLADRRIGLARRFRREPSSAIWISDGVAPRGAHAVERALSVLDGLGLEPGQPDFGGEKLFPRAPREVDGRELAGAGDYVLLHPGAGWGNKRYPPAAWGEVAARLAGGGTPVWVVSSRGEEGLARGVSSGSGGRAQVVHAATLPELAALLRRARLVLAGDTGPLHLAHALGRPVLCLMGPTDPATHGPYGAPERALWHRLPCSFCHRRFEETKACLLEISPALVADRAAAMLETDFDSDPAAGRGAVH